MKGWFSIVFSWPPMHDVYAQLLDSIRQWIGTSR